MIAAGGDCVPRLVVRAFVLVLTVLLSELAPAAFPGPDPSAEPAVYFDLDAPGSAGVLDPGKPLQLSIRLTGVQPAEDAIVAIIEGDPFVRRLVPMQHREGEQVFHSTVTLEPYFSDLISSEENALRLTATFARLQGMRLTFILTRAVYLTTALPAEPTALDTAPFHKAEPAAGRDLSDGLLERTAPVADEGERAFREQDLIPDAASPETQVYWRQVSQRIGRMWAVPASRTDRGKTRPAVGVRFRLHANGEAQLIQIERSSGVEELDEAGMKAVLRAHPFPPFPSDFPHESVDLHVELGHPLGPPTPAVRPHYSQPAR